MLTAMVIIVISSKAVFARGWAGNSSQLWMQQNPTWMNQQNLQIQQNQINQNVIQMEQVNRLIQLDQMEQMRMNTNQRFQINQDLNQLKQLNRTLETQQKIENRH
jgi:hypothetical protein